VGLSNAGNVWGDRTGTISWKINKAVDIREKSSLSRLPDSREGEKKRKEEAYGAAPPQRWGKASRLPLREVTAPTRRPFLSVFPPKGWSDRWRKGTLRPKHERIKRGKALPSVGTVRREKSEKPSRADDRLPQVQ